MVYSLLTKRTGASVGLAALVGCLMAAIPFAAGLVYAGAGHGTYLPLTLFFGPFWVVWDALPAQMDPRITSDAGMILGNLALYAVYGSIVALARAAGIGPLGAAGMTAVHYASVLWLQFAGSSGESVANALDTMRGFGLVLLLVTVQLFLAVHLVLFQYARSSVPYRPKLTRNAWIILLAGFLAGAGLFAVGGCL